MRIILRDGRVNGGTIAGEIFCSRFHGWIILRDGRVYVEL